MIMISSSIAASNEGNVYFGMEKKNGASLNFRCLILYTFLQVDFLLAPNTRKLPNYKRVQTSP